MVPLLFSCFNCNNCVFLVRSKTSFIDEFKKISILDLKNARPLEHFKPARSRTLKKAYESVVRANSRSEKAQDESTRNTFNWMFRT